MIIKKENLKRFLRKKIDNYERGHGLDVSTLMCVFDWIREYKPKKVKND